MGTVIRLCCPACSFQL